MSFFNGVVTQNYFAKEKKKSVTNVQILFLSTFLEINYILAKYKLDIFTKVRMNMSCLDTYPHKNHICLWKWNKEIEIVVAASVD